MTVVRISSLCVIAALTLAAGALHAQDQHAAMNQRGAAVMGFDQALTVHHFHLFTDGGAIEVSVKNPSDQVNRDAIRAHLPHIAMLFASGNFESPMLVHDSKDVPGTRTMAERKATIRYQYVETSSGGRVDIVTTDPASLSAVHEFLRFQIQDHHTGDPTTPRQR